MNNIKNKTREEYDEWIKTLNKFEITHLELLYMKEEKIRVLKYKNFDIWLFNKWSEENEI